MHDRLRDTVAIMRPIGAALDAELARTLETYGFAAVVDALTPEGLEKLHREAKESRAGARFSEWSRDEATASVGTASRYRASASELGQSALALLTDQLVLRLLRRHFGAEYALSPNISCTTFYDASGHLGPHLDQPADTCDVTFIICLEASGSNPDAADTGLVLNVFGEDGTKLDTPILRIPTRAGNIVFGRGSRVWHERPQLKEDESVIAITACYQRLC